jgi:hypothetical protein
MGKFAIHGLVALALGLALQPVHATVVTLNSCTTCQHGPSDYASSSLAPSTLWDWNNPQLLTASDPQQTGWMDVAIPASSSSLDRLPSISMDDISEFAAFNGGEQGQPARLTLVILITLVLGAAFRYFTSPSFLGFLASVYSPLDDY